MGTECLSPLCADSRPHVHPAVPRVLLDKLADLARWEGMRPEEVLARIAAVSAKLLERHNGYWLPHGGRGGRLSVRVPDDVDHVLNRRRPKFLSGAPYVLAFTLPVYEVIRRCESGTLSDALSWLESSYRFP